MKKRVISHCLPAFLALGNALALAQDIDFDDITMTVVAEGMFEARRIDRPDSNTIREAMNATGNGSAGRTEQPPPRGPVEPTSAGGSTQEEPARQVSETSPVQSVVQEPTIVEALQELPGEDSSRASIEPNDRDARYRARDQRNSPRQQSDARPVPANGRN